MAEWIPIPVLFVTVPLLVRAELRSNRQQVHLFKPTCTLLVISVALLSLLAPEARPSYTLWITAGLLLSLGGDVALMFPSRKAFLVGLVLFLLAHVVYATAFTVYNGFHRQDLLTAAVLLTLAAAIYLYLRPGLGRMQGPVLLYILVLCFMVHRAVSTFFGHSFSVRQAWLIALGATLFWFSDLVLAIDRFRQPLRWGQLRLALYYAGQLLIALSASYFE